MESRTILILVLVVIGVLAVGVGIYGVHSFMNRPEAVDSVTADNIKKGFIQVNDPYANKGAEALSLVQEYIQEYLAMKQKFEAANYREHGDIVDPASIPERYKTINEIVESGYLEKTYNMSFLKKDEWQTLHLDTDREDKVVADPYYEVYLYYRDEGVKIGPVWVVNLYDKSVTPRNEMAEAFDRTVRDYKEIDEKLKRPEAVVRAIISHKFESGIELGGVFLLHFMNLTKSKDPAHADDHIIGWTVEHEYRDFYNAYFQWFEKGETRVAKFRFDWGTQRLEPKGLLAIDLMAEGEKLNTLRQIDILPDGYVNNLNIPRKARWPKGTPCSTDDVKQLCTAFVKVLEQQEFIHALQWLMTGGRSNADEDFKRCKVSRKCFWQPQEAPEEVNPEKNSNLFQIGYHYDFGKGEQVINFLVDSEKETITPLDNISRWAYWSVSPRS